MAPRPHTDRPRVLGVVSDREITHLLEVVLGDQGLAVEAVGSAAEAWNVLGAAPVDVVVLDLVLPDTDGRKLLMRLRERRDTAHIPVVVLSARDDSAIKSECFALGADGFFAKPFDPDALGSLVASQLRKGRAAETEVHDPLTGLLNRAALVEAFSGLDPQSQVALALLEVDDFEELASPLGPGGGQRLLSRVGRALGEAVAPPNSLGRWEGAAFVLLLPNGSREAAEKGAETLLVRLHGSSFEGTEGSAARFTASAGVAWGRADESLQELLEQARYRLFRARAAGGDRLDAEPALGGEERRVLVAEDDPIMATILKTRLEREGFRVTVQGDGREALRAALASAPDLVILDVRMPGMDGFEVLAALRREALDHLPVVMLTSLGREADLVRAFELGADDYVVKPFSPTELLARMRRLLHRRPRTS